MTDAHQRHLDPPLTTPGISFADGASGQATSSDRERGASGARPGHLHALLLIAGALLGCTLVALISVAVFHPLRSGPHLEDVPSNPLVRAWVHWDAGWYAAIARDGYWYVPGEQSSIAFFPGYPALIALVGSLGVDLYVAGILLSVVLGCAGLFLFNRWSTRLRGDSLAREATALFVVYPFAYYLFGAMYSDAVFLFAVVGAFYALEKDRLGLVVVLGALATATRPVAPAVVLGLLVRRLELRYAAGSRPGLSDLVPTLAGLGLAAYMAYLWYGFGDPLAFVHVQSAPGWGSLEWPRSYLKVPLWEMLRDQPEKPSTWIRVVHGAAGLAALALAVPVWRRLGAGYGVYVATVISIPLLSSKDFMGVGRYVIAAFPVFLALAMMMQSTPRLRRAFAVASAIGLLVFTMAFAADQYIA